MLRRAPAASSDSLLAACMRFSCASSAAVGKLSSQIFSFCSPLRENAARFDGALRFPQACLGKTIILIYKEWTKKRSPRVLTSFSFAGLAKSRPQCICRARHVRPGFAQLGRTVSQPAKAIRFQVFHACPEHVLANGRVSFQKCLRKKDQRNSAHLFLTSELPNTPGVHVEESKAQLRNPHLLLLVPANAVIRRGLLTSCDTLRGPFFRVYEHL